MERYIRAPLTSLERAMVDYKNTKSYGKLPALLQKIRDVGVPPKANAAWLGQLGFKSSNFQTVPGILKTLGFIDQSGTPTQRWRDYKGPNHKEVLGEAIKDGYSDIFHTYPDAHVRSDAELEDVLRPLMNESLDVIKRTVSTFKSLCSVASFGEASLRADPPSGPAGPSQPGEQAAAPVAAQHLQAGPTLHIDVQVHISPESSAEQIEQIFASMAKHLYKSGDA